jgi:predicted nucleotidyltransferase
MMPVSFENLVEGYFIITSDNLVFEVKGLLHPRNRIIAYLRYVPDENQSKSGIGYQKIYELNRREDYLKSNFPDYLWFSEAHGRIVQSVAREKIVSILNPVEYLANTKHRFKTKNILQKTTNLLVKKLVHWTGISWSDIGVTGSQLLGLATEKSDIDLVVYGKDACRKFYDNLFDKFSKIPGLKPYSGELLNAHVKFRWGNLAEYYDMLKKIESKKVLQGLFNGSEFFIRLVKQPREIDEYYGKMKYEMMDYYTTSCIIRDDSDSIFTPCVYTVESSDNADLRRLVSYRGRFTEQVSIGMFVNAKGRLERVTNTITGESFLQLVLGESPADYLVPIS